jgi:hypothetical protein
MIAKTYTEILILISVSLFLLWLVVIGTLQVVSSPVLDLVRLTLVLLFFILGVIELAKKLTAGVLQGNAYRETMEVEWDGETYEVEIKPLTNKEASEVEALMQEGVTVKGKPGIKGKMQRTMDFDTRKNTFGRYDSDIKAVALGTTEKSITEDVVDKEFPPKLVKEIAKRVKQITGIGNQEEVEEFNEDVENPSEQDGEQ